MVLGWWEFSIDFILCGNSDVYCLSLRRFGQDQGLLFSQERKNYFIYYITTITATVH